ncbi:hypothetical protein SMA79_21310 [Escherichia coli]
MMSLWDALRMNMMISYQELVRTFLIGNGAKLEEIIACLDNFDLWVNIVTPN